MGRDVHVAKEALEGRLANWCRSICCLNRCCCTTVADAETRAMTTWHTTTTMMMICDHVTSTVNALGLTRLLHIYYNIVYESHGVANEVTMKACRESDAYSTRESAANWPSRSYRRPALIAKHVLVSWIKRNITDLFALAICCFSGPLIVTAWHAMCPLRCYPRATRFWTLLMRKQLSGYSHGKTYIDILFRSPFKPYHCCFL